MKTLDNKRFLLGTNEVQYSELIKTCLNNVPQGGFTPQEMKERMKILDVLETANGTIELEDADAKKMKDCVKQMKWGLLDKNLIEFIDSVEKL